MSRRDYRQHPRPLHLDLTDLWHANVRLIDPDFDEFGLPSEEEEIALLLRVQEHSAVDA